VYSRWMRPRSRWTTVAGLWPMERSSRGSSVVRVRSSGPAVRTRSDRSMLLSVRTLTESILRSLMRSRVASRMRSSPSLPDDGRVGIARLPRSGDVRFRSRLLSRTSDRPLERVEPLTGCGSDDERIVRVPKSGDVRFRSRLLSRISDRLLERVESLVGADPIDGL